MDYKIRYNLIVTKISRKYFFEFLELLCNLHVCIKQIKQKLIPF